MKYSTIFYIFSDDKHLNYSSKLTRNPNRNLSLKTATNPNGLVQIGQIPQQVV